MSAIKEILKGLFVDDDAEIVEQCKVLLPATIGDYSVHWTVCGSFEEAIQIMEETKFELVVTDVYKGRAQTGKLNVDPANSMAADVVSKAKSIGFSFIVMYSDGPCPEGVNLTASVQFVDKASNSPPFPASIEAVLEGMLQSRGSVLQVMAKLRRELERGAGSFIWEFLEQNWTELVADPEFSDSGLERLIRRRASIQINESFGGGGLSRRVNSDPYDYYIMPALPGDLRLGTLVCQLIGEQKKYHLVLTPHCHMVRHGGKPPKSEVVLLAGCKLSEEVTGLKLSQLEGKKTRIPAVSVGTPEGRYCFLPAFCGIPDLYVDLMSLSSVSFAEIDSTYVRIANVDSPFAEAIQSCLSRFYANVGHRNLQDYTMKVAPVA